MVAVPPDNPVTTPVAGSTVAIPPMAGLQEPLPSLNVVVDPAHRIATPLIAGGNAFTVTVVAIKQPAPIEYTMEAVPTVTPPTIPVAPMVATAVLPLLQLPPPPSASVLVDPGHTWALPVIIGGLVSTVSIVVALQPSGSV